MNILNNDQLVSVIDRAKLSDRNAFMVLAAASSSMGTNLKDTTLSYSSIRRTRISRRKEIANSVKNSFIGVEERLLIHWDGKLMPTMKDSSKKEERLPIIVSGKGVEKILSVPKLLNGKGSVMADAIYQAVDDWNLQNNIVGMCFDTTASNTGVYNGACTLFEDKIEKKLLYFACRHHFHEVIIADVFKECFGTTSGPEVLLFTRFREQWSSIDTTKIDSSARFIESGQIPTLIQNTISFVKTMLINDSQPRSDYRELLDLTMIYCGETPPRGIKFKVPGAFHHARWMAKLIYCLKIYIFKNQFKLSKKEEEGLIKFNTFSCLVYMESWFSCPISTDATINDLNLIENLYKFKEINKSISDVAIKALKRHLWYFTEEMVGISFFSEKISFEEKVNMVNNLDKPSKNTNVHKYKSDNSEAS